MFMDLLAAPAIFPAEAISVLLIGPNYTRRRLLRGILAPPQWDVREAATYAEALRILNTAPISVTIYDAETQQGTWQALLAEIQHRDAPPNLIVSSRLADERLWAEVLNLGGYDVLLEPFDRAEVLRVAYMAWRAWRRDLPASGSLPNAGELAAGC